MNARLDRRRLLLAGLGACVAGQAQARQGLYPLRSDAGHGLQNERIPSDLDPAETPGVVWVGAQASDVVLVEYFDYNCPICRGAVRQIDAIKSHDPDTRFGLVNNPILSPASVEAAMVQQSVLRSNGPDATYHFHKRLLSIHGVADHSSALSVASALGLDMGSITQGLADPRVAHVVKAQKRDAASLGFTVTPSFVLHGVAILGWPGLKSTQAMIASVRACEKPYCRPG